MSAVTLYQDELLSRDLNEGDAGDDFFNCGSGPQSGLSGLSGARCKTPAQVVAETHQAQSFTMYVRQAAAVILASRDRTLRPVFDGDHAMLLIEPVVTDEEAPPWSPIGDRKTDGGYVPGSLGRVSILANVKKMGCPSFSLPAGTQRFMGTCPGALHGMTIESPEVLTNIKKKAAIAQIVGMAPVPPETWYSTAVCQHCYAVKANYIYFSKQLASLAVLAWTQAALANGTFVPVMIEAIERSPFHQGSKEDLRRIAPLGYERVFRLHDSGDFFSAGYTAAWKQIIDYFMPGKGPGTPTIFWAPSRLWAAGTNREGRNLAREWLAVFGECGDLRRSNILVRPSGYNTDQRCPKPVLGEVAGSTVHVGDEIALKEAGVFDYVCPASRVDAKSKTCLQVIGPDKKLGCRACWTLPEITISYHIH